ncbi:MAG: hypothetical protein AB7O21_19565 [Gammaproteobacteria bacterium]
MGEKETNTETAIAARAEDARDEAPVYEGPRLGLVEVMEVFAAMQNVARAELSKGPGVASNAWRELYDSIARAFDDDELAHATPQGRQPMMIPPGFKHPIPAKRGATPTRPDQGTQPTPGDIRARDDVKAELERIRQRGGR